MNAAVAAQEVVPFSLRPYSPTIGAEVSGIDLAKPLTDVGKAALYQALLDWKVLFFRDQDITTEQHLAFARCFGELEQHPFAPHKQGYPDVLAITHDADRPGRENGWHSDVTWRLEPSLGSVLRNLECPSVGGDTLFADMYAAYEGLPESIREKVEGRVAVHDFGRFRDGLRAKGASDEEIAAFDARYPNPEHPVIRTHPDTGRQAIYVNRAFTKHIVGRDREESDRLLEILYRQAWFPEYQCRFHWETNSIAFWDNRACQHYAASDYWPQVRKVERVTIVGDAPYYCAGGPEPDHGNSPFRGNLSVQRNP